MLRPGGLLVLDTLNDTGAEPVRHGDRWPSALRGVPKGIHDPALFVDPAG